MVDGTMKTSGSIPAASTKNKTSGDYARPLQPTSHVGSVPCRKSIPLVSSGLVWAPDGHKSGTNGTKRAQTSARQIIFNRHPKFARKLRWMHQFESRHLSTEQADLRLTERDSDLSFGSLNLTRLTKRDVEREAENYAMECNSVLDSALSDGDKKARIQSLFTQLNTPFDFSEQQKHRIVKRDWWKRRIYRERSRAIASILRDLGDVHADSPYIDNTSVLRVRLAQIEQRAYLENTTAVNELGQRCTLAELHDSSVANPTNRRIEMMVRFNGIDAWAVSQGHHGLFVTLTTPSKMHRYGRGKLNVHFNRVDPRSANAHLNRVWQRCRSFLDQQGVRLYGLRVVEPHQDGTPHWHLCLYSEPRHIPTIKRALRKFGLERDGTEPGAARHRVDIKDHDREGGCVLAYFAKYLSKNVDGHNLATDDHGHPIATAVERTTAWARTFGIRQFQFFGDPSITIWRDLRKLDQPLGVQPLLESLRQAARSGDYLTYIDLMGGMGSRISRPVKRLPSNLDEETGEILKGEEFLPTPFLSCEGVLTALRTHQWRIETPTSLQTQIEPRQRRGVDCAEATAEALGLLSITVRPSKAAYTEELPNRGPPP